MPSHPPSRRTSLLLLDGEPLAIADVRAVAAGRRQVELTANRSVMQRMEQSVAIVRQAVDRGERVYGVTTGFGSMVEVDVPGDQAEDLQGNLLAFLAAGGGAALDPQHVRGAMLLRANMLLRGISGVRPEIVRRMVRFLAEDVVPVVRELGSIGASGDLIPLAVIARAVTGQGGSCRVSWKGSEMPSGEALRALGFEPLPLLPKEALAIVNGTTFSSAIAANSVHDTRGLLALALGVHAIMFRALAGHDDPYEAFVHEVKPHAGQVWTVRVMRRLLQQPAAARTADGAHAPHLQDRYSLRCLPQYLGPIVEGIARVQHVVAIEMNSVTDNPLVDIDGRRFYQSGNFLGQYIGVAMDDLRRCLGLLAKHLDVQIAQLVSPEFNQGLPASLKGNERLAYNMGLKGLQITGNAIMPLLTYYGNPLVEHFPTHAEQYNQNINGLSWGAANLAWRSVELAQHYLAVALIFAVQAADLRAKVQFGHYDGRALLNDEAGALYAAVQESLGVSASESKPLIYNDADQSLEELLASLQENIRCEGSLIESVAPILTMFDQTSFGC